MAGCLLGVACPLPCLCLLGSLTCFALMTLINKAIGVRWVYSNSTACLLCFLAVLARELARVLTCWLAADISSAQYLLYGIYSSSFPLSEVLCHVLYYYNRIVEQRHCCTSVKEFCVLALRVHYMQHSKTYFCIFLYCFCFVFVLFFLYFGFGGLYLTDR